MKNLIIVIDEHRNGIGCYIERRPFDGALVLTGSDRHATTFDAEQAAVIARAYADSGHTARVIDISANALQRVEAVR